MLEKAIKKNTMIDFNNAHRLASSSEQVGCENKDVRKMCNNVIFPINIRLCKIITEHNKVPPF